MAKAAIPDISKDKPDRRKSPRFPVRQEIRYRFRRVWGQGRTLDISSSGIRFSTEHTLPPGQLAELEVNWPVLLDGTCPLKLVAKGRVVRSEARLAAVEIERYEFRTRRPAATGA